VTSTTSAFIPAASRAGAPAYSPDTAASLGSSDASETRSFDELCSDHDAHAETGHSAEQSEADEPAALRARDDAAGEAENTGEEEHDDEDERDESARRVVALPALESPSIIQTLLASLRTEPAMPANAIASGPSAENADAQATLANTGTSVRAEGRQGSAGTPEAAAAALAAIHRRLARGAGAPGEGVAPDATARTATASTPASVVSKGAGAESTAAGAATAVQAKAGATPVEEAGTAGVTRLVQARGHAEKSAAQHGAAVLGHQASGQNKFLVTEDQPVANTSRPAGTRAAIATGTMSSSTSTATQRPVEGSVPLNGSSPTAGQGAWTESLSVDWKGWTNGGGERSSTAAQFSQLGDKLGHHGVAATPATAGVARTATPAPTVATAAPTVPADAAEALAPIHSAIERLVLHGRDQLALTVRFEQGGSLSIRLAMNQGEIATQIQTDVPGLEAALKSAWGELAQDWNSRGWKLGQPEFSGGTQSYHSRQDAATADDRGAGRQARQGSDGMPDFGDRAFAPARLKHSRSVTLSGLDALRAAALARRGIHTWA